MLWIIDYRYYYRSILQIIIIHIIYICFRQIIVQYCRKLGFAKTIGISVGRSSSERRVNTLTSTIASMGPMKAYLRPFFSGNQQLQKNENS